MRDYEFRYDRRREGFTTYTWATARRIGSDTWVSLGDPWPCITPPWAELLGAADRIYADIDAGRRDASGDMTDAGRAYYKAASIFEPRVAS